MKYDSQLILDFILDDISNGYNHKWTEYLIHFPRPTSEEERLRFLNRVHRLVSDNRQLINEAKKEYELNNGNIITHQDSNCELKNVCTATLEAKNINEKKSLNSVSIEEYLEYCKVGQDIGKRFENRQYEKTINIKNGEILLFTADWHLSSLGVDYKKFAEDMEFVIDNDIRMCIVGDALENKTLFSRSLQASLVEQIINPLLQEDLLTKLLIRFMEKEQVLCYVQGNHDQSSKGTNIHNACKEACKKANVDFFSGGCLLILKNGKHTHRAFLRHSPLGSSKISPLSNVRKLSTLENADIFIAGHLHTFCSGTDLVLGKKRICCLLGTYGTTMGYAQDGYGFHGSASIFPSILFIDGEYLLFEDMRQAVIYRNILLDNQGV